MRQRRLEHVELTAQQAVDGVEAGHVRRRALNETEAPRAREQAEVVEEHDQQDQPEPERGHGDSAQRQHAGNVVGDLVAMQRGDDSQGNADAQCEDQRRRGELHGGREPADQDLPDRLGGIVDGDAEIAAQHVADIAQVLFRQRAVETVDPVHGLDVDGVDAHAADRRPRADRIDRGGVQDDEGDGDHAEQHQHMSTLRIM